HETAVLPDGVATHGRLARRHMLRKKLEHAFFGLGFGQRRRLHLVDQPAAPMGGLIPFVHGVEQRGGSMHDQHRALGDKREVGFGNDGRQFNDALSFRIEPGHFSIDPHEALFYHHPLSPYSKKRFARKPPICSLCCSLPSCTPMCSCASGSLLARAATCAVIATRCRNNSQPASGCTAISAQPITRWRRCAWAWSSGWSRPWCW